MKIPLNLNWDNQKREEWKKNNCSAEERNTEYTSAFYQASYEVDPITATSWTQCIKLKCVPEALVCSIIETDSSVIFEARWRRSPGEKDSAAPQVKRFAFNNTQCKNAADLSAGKTFSDAGIAILCSQNMEAAPTFMLVTSRGFCSQATDLTKKEFPLSGKIVLDKPTTYKSPRIVLKDSLRLITQGYPLSIVAGTLVVEGSPQIVSYEDTTRALGQPGRSAAEVRLQADRLEGSGLTISNFGEKGSKGNPGAKGATGGKGKTGRRRDWSCGGGSRGDTGGQGGTGGTGITGAAGGSPGEVIISIKRGFQQGALSEIRVLTKQQNPEGGGEIDCGGMICGGIGGEGGDGGEGGNGGEGGDGAPGTVTCDGTRGGDQGPPGPKGAPGKRGPSGNPAQIKYF